jgi:hypothetical protein
MLEATQESGTLTELRRPPARSADATPRPAAGGDAELEVRAYAPGDEVALIAIFSSTFRERSIDEWRWLFSRRPGGRGDLDIRVLTCDGRVVGSVSHIGTDVWVGGERRRLAMGADMMILPECRGRGGAELLVRSFRACDHGFDMNFGTVNAGSGHVTKRYMGTAVLGFSPLWLRAAVPERTTLARTLAHHALRAYGALLSLGRPREEVVDLDALGPEVDRLAQESAGFARCIRVRDSRYLRWHWREDPRTSWRIRAVWGADGTLRGVAVSGARVDGGERRGVIADLLARDRRALRALVLDAYEHLRAEGVATVACTYRDPRPWARIAMLRAGFRRSLRPGLRVGCGPLSPRAGDEIVRKRSWYLTGADTDL